MHLRSLTEVCWFWNISLYPTRYKHIFSCSQMLHAKGIRIKWVASFVEAKETNIVVKEVTCNTTSAWGGSWYFEVPISVFSLFWYWYPLSNNLKSAFSLSLYWNPLSKWFSTRDVRSPIFSCDEKKHNLYYNNLSISTHSYYKKDNGNAKKNGNKRMEIKTVDGIACLDFKKIGLVKHLYSWLPFFLSYRSENRTFDKVECLALQQRSNKTLM